MDLVSQLRKKQVIKREEGDRIEPSNRILHVSLQTPALVSGVPAQRYDEDKSRYTLRNLFRRGMMGLFRNPLIREFLTFGKPGGQLNTSCKEEF